jgi:hypothetical protein
MRFRLHAAVFILGFHALAAGALQETVPTWHWSYAVIDALQARGAFGNLGALTRPYTRADVARALIAFGAERKAGKPARSPEETRLVRKLLEEFLPDVQAVEKETRTPDRLEWGLRGQGDLRRDPDRDPRFLGVVRSRLSVPLGGRAVLFNAMALDRYALDDSLYAGKKWRGLAYYAEQAYAAAEFGRLRVKFGRDFMRWGAGRYGTLLISDVCRPMDQLSGSVDVGPLRFSFITSVLDPLTFTPAQSDSFGGVSARRFLSAHRLDGRFFGGRLQLGITEAVLYGGVNRPLEWVFLNPLLSAHAEQVNEKVGANTLGTVDCMAYPAENFRIYGSCLIDDIQVEKTGPGDLEPDEIGMIAGAEWSDPLSIGGLSLNAEYARVTNRTYKTKQPWESAVYRNRPIGHPLGNDFDFAAIGATAWLSGSVRAEASWTKIRKGEGGLFSPFDMPWMEYTVEQGYHEPFPTGVVERRSELGFSLRWIPERRFALDAEIRSRRTEQAGHVRGSGASTVLWRLGVWCAFDSIVSLGG